MSSLELSLPVILPLGWYGVLHVTLMRDELISVTRTLVGGLGSTGMCGGYNSIGGSMIAAVSHIM